LAPTLALGLIPWLLALLFCSHLESLFKLCYGIHSKEALFLLSLIAGVACTWGLLYLYFKLLFWFEKAHLPVPAKDVSRTSSEYVRDAFFRCGLLLTIASWMVGIMLH